MIRLISVLATGTLLTGVAPVKDTWSDQSFATQTETNDNQEQEIDEFALPTEEPQKNSSETKTQICQ